MKKSYKIMALLLVAIMCVGCFTGCGKTEEEKAMEEIAEKFEEGMDDAEEIKDAMEEVSNKAQKNDAVIKSLNENEFVQILEAYKAYEEATDADSIVSAAENMNSLIDKTLEKALKETTLSKEEILSKMELSIHVSNKIPEWEYKSLAQYFSIHKEMTEGNVYVSWNAETKDYLFFFYDYNSVTGTIVKKDGSICKVNVTDVVTNATGFDIAGLDNEKLILYVYGDESMNCSFDVSGSEAKLIDKNVEEYLNYESFTSANNPNDVRISAQYAY